MQQKTKMIILIALIVFIIFATAVFMFKKTKNLFNLGEQNKQAEQLESEKQKEGQTGDFSKSFTTIEIKGTVAAISKDSIEIQDGETKNTFSLAENIAVLSVSGSKVAKKSVSDLKKGQNVSLMLNQANSEIVSIQILEGRDSKALF
ncbi:MAG: hypothetical protein WC906_02725 [Parcubacteria group bacterium]|jgi:uncharacterized protein YxeA